MEEKYAQQRLERRKAKRRQRLGEHKKNINYRLAKEIDRRLIDGNAAKRGPYGRVFLYGQPVKVWVRIGATVWAGGERHLDESKLTVGLMNDAGYGGAAYYNVEEKTLLAVGDEAKIGEAADLVMQMVHYFDQITRLFNPK
jgi:hypothetical protein